MDLKDSPLIQGVIQNTDKMPRAEAEKLFGGITGVDPGVDVKRRLGLMTVAAEAAPLFQGEEQQFGKLLGKVNELTPDKNESQIVGKALALREAAGEHAENLTGNRFRKTMGTLIEAKIDPDTAMALGVVGMRAGQERSAALMAAAGSLEHTFQPEEFKHKPILRKFSHADAAERWKLLQDNPAVQKAVLGDEQALAFRQIKPAEVEDVRKHLIESQNPDFIENELKMLGKSPLGRERLLERDTATLNRKNERIDRELAERRARQEAEFEATNVSGKSIYQRTLNKSDWQISKWTNPDNPVADYLAHSGNSESAKQLLELNDKTERQIKAMENMVDYLVKIYEAQRTSAKKVHPAAVQGNRTKGP
jgi:hypothetical protein